jgi:hypothetical protein
MNDKIKEKIEKLLNLSMSDNEHEASLALDFTLISLQIGQKNEYKNINK